VGNAYTYTICNPESGEPWPGDPKKPFAYVKKRENVVANARNEGGPRVIPEIAGIRLSFERPV
jgi:hypothetical protein